MKNIKRINVSTSSVMNSTVTVTFEDDLVLSTDLSDEAAEQIRAIAKEDFLKTINSLSKNDD